MIKIDIFSAKKRRLSSVLVAMFAILLLFVWNESSAQVNRHNRKNNFSGVGRSKAVIRHGLTFHLHGFITARSEQMEIVPAFGVGYTATQYYGIGNRFMQQSATYSFGFGLADVTYFVHSLSGTFHCSYIGGLDLNPFIYGIAIQMAYTPKVKRSDDKENAGHVNFYIRPEIGLAFPFSYQKRTKEVHRVTGSLTYGFNIRTFYNYNSTYAERTGESPTYYPFSAMNHHVVTLRLNFNFINMREMRK